MNEKTWVHGKIASDLVVNAIVSEAAFLKMKKRIEEILN